MKRALSASALMLTAFAFAALASGCYTQFSPSTSTAEFYESTERDSGETATNGGDIIINNYYDAYYYRFLRPMIYGYGAIWWWDPFWDYPLWWYSPIIAPPPYWAWWRPDWRWWWGYPPGWNGGVVVSTEPIGTRRIGIGRTRSGALETSVPTSSSTRYGGASGTSSGATISPSRRQRSDGAIDAFKSDANRRTSSTETRGTTRGSATSDSRSGYGAPRRQSSGGSYSPPASRGSSSSSAPSRSGGGASSSSGSVGRRQR